MSRVQLKSIGQVRDPSRQPRLMNVFIHQQIETGGRRTAKIVVMASPRRIEFAGGTRPAMTGIFVSVVANDFARIASGRCGTAQN